MESFIVLAFIDFMIWVVFDRRTWLLWQLKCCPRLIMEKNEKMGFISKLLEIF